MNITVNGEPHEVSDASLDTVLTELGYTDARVATAVNGTFVPVDERASVALSPGDRVEVLAPMQGG